ncbi:MAG: hypothetical protein ACFCU8_17430 [Thermosynechococcaceae cyanobacterium]
MQKLSLSLIKSISILLISTALGLELWNLWWTHTTQSQFPEVLPTALSFDRILLTVHAIEGVIAAAYAPSKQKQPVFYGIYTFFTGMVGLVELFQPQEHPQ